MSHSYSLIGVDFKEGWRHRISKLSFSKYYQVAYLIKRKEKSYISVNKKNESQATSLKHEPKVHDHKFIGRPRRL